MRWRRFGIGPFGQRVPGSVGMGGGTIGSSVSTSTLTTWAVIVATTSVLLLVVLDRRQPARRQRVTPRAGILPRAAPAVVEVTQVPTRTYRRTPIWRRVLSLTYLGSFGLVLGALLALLLAVVIVGGFLLIGHIAG
jgi:hypothetical protein